MKRLHAIIGISVVMGAIYWWQLQLTAFAGDGALPYSLSCLVSGGYNNCPILDTDLRQDNLIASIMFYAGVFLLLYLVVFSKPPHMPKFHLDGKLLSVIRRKK